MLKGLIVGLAMLAGTGMNNVNLYNYGESYTDEIIDMHEEIGRDYVGEYGGHFVKGNKYINQIQFEHNGEIESAWIEVSLDDIMGID